MLIFAKLKKRKFREKNIREIKKKLRNTNENFRIFSRKFSFAGNHIDA